MLVVWGPLMVGGTYYAAVGNLPWEVVLASLPYALLCTTVLMGKHIDKIPWDEPDGTHTLPVILGERRARALTQVMMVAFYPLVGAAWSRSARCRCSRSLVPARRRPARRRSGGRSRGRSRHEPPDGFPIWPLWFAALAFVHTRLAGGLLVARHAHRRHPRHLTPTSVANGSETRGSTCSRTMQDFPLTIGMIFRHGAAVHGDSEVVTFEGEASRRASFAEVADRAERLAAALAPPRHRARRPRRHVLWNTQEHLEAYFAVPCMGAVLHTLNIRLFPEQLTYVVNHAEDRVVIVDDIARPAAREGRAAS